MRVGGFRIRHPIHGVRRRSHGPWRRSRVEVALGFMDLKYGTWDGILSSEVREWVQVSKVYYLKSSGSKLDLEEMTSNADTYSVLGGVRILTHEDCMKK